VEVVVRGYITGVTSTSLWTLYDQGVDRPYGLTLPKGMRKNDPLPHPVITPTTKAAPGQHDERLTNDEVVSLGLVDADLWSKVQHIALEIFSRGQTLAAKAGLILVDTKYEFGMVDGELVLIDEVHTPDSSRYWQSATYDHTRQPKSLDKEHVRSWLASHGFRGDGQSPPIPDDLAVELATRYVSAFEQITGQTFEPAAAPAAPQIQQSIKPWRIS
jgi:phosphoribosylaminoimidazole-succinocarboxamide synthase